MYQRIIIMKSKINGEDLSTMANSSHIPSRKRERQRRHAPSILDLPSLTTLLEKESQQHPLNPTRINAVSI